MKKTLKIVGIILSVVIIIGVVGAIYVNSKGIPSYPVEKVDYKIYSTPSGIKRGKKLAMMLCVNCHTDPKTGKLTGTQMLDAPKEFGKIFSANITQDKTHGIGDWTDAELMYLLRTGIKRDGKYAPPYMPKFPTMADEDLEAIIAFLKSDDPLVAADNTEDFPTEPSLLTKFLCMVAFKPLPMPQQEIILPDTTDKIALGKYLAHNLECFSCHSADFKTNNFLTPELSEGYFGGGNKPLNKKGEVMVTPNLTPDVETGIGSWSEAKFIKALKFGVKEGEEALRYPMVPYPHLSDVEAKAIYEYLKTIPPIQNKVERSVTK